MSTHNRGFRAKIRKKSDYPCTPQLYYTKVGCKGVFVTRICFRDEKLECLEVKKSPFNLILSAY